MLAHTNDAPAPSSDLAARMMPTVHRVARQLARRLPRHIRVDDLVSAGCQGLADALERFDPERRERFESYAALRIRGAMLDELRAFDPLSRDQRAAANRIAAATRALCARLGRAPGADEIAAALGVPLETYWEQLSAAATDAEAPFEDDDAPGEHAHDTHAEPADEHLCRKELTAAVNQAIAALPARLQRVLELHYVDGLTLREIGDVLGVTESRVCQLRTDALRRLRAFCSEYADHATAAEPASSTRPAQRRRVRAAPAHATMAA